VAIADLNGDGKLDLLVTNIASGDGSILLGNGNGTFQAAQTVYAGGSPLGLAVADLNGDGKTDIVVVNLGANTISVFLNTSSY